TLLAGVVLGTPSFAHAQPDLVPSPAEGDDPIGLVPPSDLERAPARAPSTDTGHPRVRPLVGPILTAISGVRESAHRTSVRIEHGLAWVRTDITLSNSARYPAEVRYRLSMPADASLMGVGVCVGEVCRQGIPADDGAAYEAALKASSAS